MNWRFDELSFNELSFDKLSFDKLSRHDIMVSVSSGENNTTLWLVSVQVKSPLVMVGVSSDENQPTLWLVRVWGENHPTLWLEWVFGFPVNALTSYKLTKLH